MKQPHYEGDRVKIYHGDALEVLATMPDRSVNCCVTSPPYWGLRDYGTATWEGGDEACDHVRPNDCGPNAQVGNTKANVQRFYTSICGKCNARRVDAQIGLESTPDAYVARMVDVFRQVRRVLRDDGTLWLNLGDSYNNAGSSRNGEGLDGTRRGGATGPNGELGYTKRDNRHALRASGIKHKDLVGIPWRVAFALQEDGWWLRQDIIWHKKNSMPESVTDRCTKSHEYIFLLSKSARYYFDAEAIAEPVAPSTIERMSQPALDRQVGSDRVPGKTNGTMKAVLKRSGNKARKDATERGCPSSGVAGNVPWEGSTRNKRSVWSVSVKGYKGAHFATFPKKLIEPCIKAGCPAGGVVLDPFTGSGTTAVVAREHGCEFVGVELNASYIDLAAQRLSQSVLF